MKLDTSKVGRLRGTETFSTEEEGVMAYTDHMPHVDDNTVIIKDNSHKSIDNFSVKVLENGFDLWLFHATKITGNHVDEAELVGTWHFESLDHLKKQVKLIEESVKRQGRQDCD